MLIFMSMPSQQHLPFFMDMLVFMHMPFFPQQLAAIAGDAAMTTSAAVATRSFFTVFSISEVRVKRSVSAGASCAAQIGRKAWSRISARTQRWFDLSEQRTGLG